MKNKLNLLVVAIIGVVTALPFAGCRKGPDDPFISIKSRDTRLMRAWKLTKIDWTTTDKTSSGTDTDKTTGDGKTSTTVHTPSSGTGSTTTVPYTLDIEFKDNGVYTETELDSATTTKETGSWWWKEGDADKVYLVTSIPSGTETWFLQRLSSSELIGSLETSSSSTINGVTTSKTISAKITFAAK